MLVAAVASVAVMAVILGSNRRLAAANQTIHQNYDQIRRQYQELGESNRNLAQARAEAEKERDQAKEVTKFLVSSFRKPDPEQDGKEVKMAEVLGRAVKELEGRAKVAPTTRATIFSAVGETYSGLGLVPETVVLCDKASSIFLRELGEHHPDTLTALNNLAWAYHDAGQFDRAITLGSKR